MSNFEDAYKEYGIALYVIPPRTPELNGNVERANRTLRYDFIKAYLSLVSLEKL